MLRQRHGDVVAQAAAQLIDGTERLGGFISVCTDPRSPRLFLNFRTPVTGKVYWPLLINPRPGMVALQLRWLAHHPAFEDETVREESARRIEEAAEVSIDAPLLDGSPCPRSPTPALSTGCFASSNGSSPQPAAERRNAPALGPDLTTDHGPVIAG